MATTILSFINGVMSSGAFFVFLTVLLSWLIHKSKVVQKRQTFSIWVLLPAMVASWMNVAFIERYFPDTGETLKTLYSILLVVPYMYVASQILKKLPFHFDKEKAA